MFWKRTKRAIGPFIPRNESGTMLAILTEAENTIATSRAYAHPFLAELRSVTADREAARRFAVQWYKAATAHKKSFPGLVYNVQNDEIRLSLIDILNEEYGFGELDQVHARVLWRFLEALGISLEDVEAEAAEEGVAYFSRHVDEAWLNSDPDFAYGVHYALEFLAANMHKAFYANVARLGLPEEAIAYFRIHSVAEVEHAEKARRGLSLLGTDGETQERVAAGMALGTELVEKLLDGLAAAYSGRVH